MPVEERRERPLGKGVLASEHLIEDHAERVDI
jgi:hypothetical protein